MRKGEEAKEEMVKDVNGQILRDGIEVRKRLLLLLLLLLKNVGSARLRERCTPYQSEDPSLTIKTYR